MSGRVSVRRWLLWERRLYADIKWWEGSNRADAIAHMRDDADDGWWLDYVRTYLSRAEQMGLASPQGRQQMGKAIVTALSCLETAVEVHGPMPRPGAPSGEVQPWVDAEAGGAGG